MGLKYSGFPITSVKSTSLYCISCRSINILFLKGEKYSSTLYDVQIEVYAFIKNS